MTAATHHRLAGLEPDNLLAFMALLGLLRALDTIKPDWRARAYWDVERHPLRPVLVLAAPATQQEVAEAAAQGVKYLAKAHQFDRKDLKFSAEEARRELTDEMSDSRRDLIEALISDGASDKDGMVRRTPLCLIMAQGHQHFLARLKDVPAGELPTKLRKLKKPPDLTASSFLLTALFESWKREDPGEGFRWDPAEDRRYALRADNPSGDPAGSQHGANRLAAVSIALLSGAVMRRRTDRRFLCRMSSYDQTGSLCFTWPLWNQPARLSGIKALLAHPALSQRVPALADLQTLGVVRIMRAKRISVAQMLNVTYAEQVV